MDSLAAMNSTLRAPIAAPYFPIYHFARPDVIPGMPDKFTSVFAPFAIYWIFSLFFHAIDTSGLFEQYRIHEPDDEKKKNRVTVKQVIWGVLLQQVIQTALALVWLEDDGEGMGPFRDHASSLLGWKEFVGKVAGKATMDRFGDSFAQGMYWWAIPVFQFFFASFVLDTWQYFLHRYFHTNKFLYRHVHSWHHRLYVPYAFGALYNHPVEGFVFDTLGATIAHSCALMSIRQGILFFAISTAKTVDDHCGFNFPLDPFQHLFGNNSDYHDIHHQIAGLKMNFSQPYFIHFDYFLGTRMTRKQFDAKKIANREKGAKMTRDKAMGSASSEDELVEHVKQE